MSSNLKMLLREAIGDYHVTGMIRDHADPNQPGWVVAGIETCEDALCVDALVALAEDSKTFTQAELAAALARAIDEEQRGTLLATELAAAVFEDEG